MVPVGTLPAGDALWAARDTTPAQVGAALRELVHGRRGSGACHVPARVLNLIAIVDRRWRGEIANRLDRVGRHHASRTLLCSVDPGRTTLDARIAVTSERAAQHAGSAALSHEGVELDIGPGHLAGLATIADPLIAHELTTLVWAPHGHAEAIDALLGLADSVLIDSLDEPKPRAAFARAAVLAERSHLVDLAWLRSAPWRERVCAAFDPPARRAALQHISSATVRHRTDSEFAALLFLGWLCSRLGWRPEELMSGPRGLTGSARARRQEVSLALEPSGAQPVPGLAGVTIATDDGYEISLDRGPGGLVAERRAPGAAPVRRRLLGASRGEGGILGEGVRQALLRDPTYRPALAAACEMAP